MNIRAQVSQEKEGSLIQTEAGLESVGHQNGVTSEDPQIHVGAQTSDPFACTSNNPPGGKGDKNTAADQLSKAGLQPVLGSWSIEENRQGQIITSQQPPFAPLLLHLNERPSRFISSSFLVSGP